MRISKCPLKKNYSGLGDRSDHEGTHILCKTHRVSSDKHWIASEKYRAKSLSSNLQ